MITIKRQKGTGRTRSWHSHYHCEDIIIIITRIIILMINVIIIGSSIIGIIITIIIIIIIMRPKGTERTRSWRSHLLLGGTYFVFLLRGGFDSQESFWSEWEALRGAPEAGGP